ncbi:MAG TPA: CBS domain-containing protein [Dehalococcoidia bacterium]|nr:CBS domain-containing protein [Dehalococcoidia bacterium]
MDGGVANAQSKRNVMICPDCRAENIEGMDICEVCGADLRNEKLPSPNTEFEEQLMNHRLAELGASEALAVSPEDPVALAVHFMREHEAECVLVRDNEDRIAGILSERGILLKAAGPGTDLMALKVKDIMTEDPVMLREGDSLAVALHKMSVGGFRHIPFVASDGTTLMVSILDVFRYVANYIPHN